jgi:hypothetical protein
MSMNISELRNSGYPYIEDLPEMSSVSSLKSPYPEYIIRRVTGKCMEYPCNPMLVEFERAVNNSFRRPFPEYIMKCMGEDINDGYPLTGVSSGISRKYYSELFIDDKQITGMYYGNTEIYEAYYKGRAVFKVWYE